VLYTLVYPVIHSGNYPASLAGGGTIKPAHFLEKYPTFTTISHQPPTPDDNNLNT
jgi:hypothetical protein